MTYAVAIAIVILILCSITIYKATGLKTQADFLVAGRTLSWPVLVFTLLSSWIGAGEFASGSGKCL